MIVGDYLIVGSIRAAWKISGATRDIGSALFFQRNVNGDWTKEKELNGCYSNYKGTYCKYGQAVAIGVKDLNREFVVINQDTPNVVVVGVLGLRTFLKFNRL